MSTKAIREALATLPKRGKYDSYPNEPIGDGNPYYRCCACKRSDPEISVRGHYDDCEWFSSSGLREAAEAELDAIEQAAADILNPDTESADFSEYAPAMHRYSSACDLFSHIANDAKERTS